MAGDTGAADEKFSCAFRDARGMASEFFSGGRSGGAAFLLGLAADEYADAEFPPAGSVRGAGVHGGREQNRGLAKELRFSYACGVLRALRVRLFVLLAFLCVFAACPVDTTRAWPGQVASSPDDSPVVT